MKKNIEKPLKNASCFVNFVASSSPYKSVRLRRALLVSSHYIIFQRFLGFAIFFVLISLLAVTFGFIAIAQDSDSGNRVPVTDIIGKCAKGLQGYLDVAHVEFGAFINQHFASSKPTSELIPNAIAKYREYRASARSEMLKLSAPRSGDLAYLSAAQRSECELVLRTDFDMMNELLRTHISANASAKKATRIINKYKTINEKLSRLNFSIGQLYGYFAGFNDKLPCFPASCVTN